MEPLEKDVRRGERAVTGIQVQVFKRKKNRNLRLMYRWGGRHQQGLAAGSWVNEGCCVVRATKSCVYDTQYDESEV